MTEDRKNTLLTLDVGLTNALKAEAQQQGRSASRQLEKILNERYQLYPEAPPVPEVTKPTGRRQRAGV